MLIKFLIVSKNPPPDQIGWYKRFGGGRSVTVNVLDKSKGRDFIISFQRKIAPEDVREGKLLPLMGEEIIRRGGKRSGSIRISFESAEALTRLLQESLKDIEDQKIMDEGTKTIGMTMLALTHSE